MMLDTFAMLSNDDLVSASFSMDGTWKILWLDHVIITFGIVVRDNVAKGRGMGQLACWAGHFIPLCQAALNAEDIEGIQHFLESLFSVVRKYTKGRVDMRRRSFVCGMDESPAFFAALRNSCPKAIVNHDFFHVIRNARQNLRKKLVASYDWVELFWGSGVSAVMCSEVGWVGSSTTGVLATACAFFKHVCACCAAVQSFL